MSSNIQRKFFALNVRRDGPQPSIFVRSFGAITISEIATLRIDQCQINQRAGSITLLDAKGDKTRTLDLHNMARRALYEYLFPTRPQDRERDEESAYVFTSQRAAWLRQQGARSSFRTGYGASLDVGKAKGK